MIDPEGLKLTRREQINKNRAISIDVTIGQYPDKYNAFIGRNEIITYSPKSQSIKTHKGKWMKEFLFSRLFKSDWKLWDIPHSESGFGICMPYSGEGCSLILCENCGKPLDGTDPRRKYCPGGKCKSEALNKRRKTQWIHECPNCHKIFEARDKAIYCSHRCRMQYKRKIKKAGNSFS